MHLDERAVLAISSPGADGQVQTLVQVLDAPMREREELGEVLVRPRWRSQEGRLLLEASFPDVVASRLAQRAHRLTRLPDGHSAFGFVAAAGFDRSTTSVLDAADPRRETSATAW